MFSTKIRVVKAFAAKQKIREFKKRLCKAIERRLAKRIKPNKLIQKAANILNKTKSAKYGFAPAEHISDEQFKEEYDFYMLQNVNEDAEKRERSDRNKYIKQRKKLKEPLNLGESVYVPAERLKKKDTLGKLYNFLTENKPFFNKDQLFTVRQELFTLRGQFI